jgi:hypothetical protein
VRVLDEARVFLETRHFGRRNICGFKQDSRCVNLEYIRSCHQQSKFSRISRILSEDHQRILEDHEAHDRVTWKNKKFKWTLPVELVFRN